MIKTFQYTSDSALANLRPGSGMCGLGTAMDEYTGPRGLGAFLIRNIFGDHNY